MCVANKLRIDAEPQQSMRLFNNYLTRPGKAEDRSLQRSGM